MIGSGTPLYHEVVDFLYAEADLLDRQDLRGWLAHLTEDIRYVVPVRSEMRWKASLRLMPSSATSRSTSSKNSVPTLPRPPSASVIRAPFRRLTNP